MKNPLDEVVKQEGATSLDRVMAQAPSNVTDADLTVVIATMRKDRALFIKAEQSRAERKEGINDGGNSDTSQEQTDQVEE